MSSTGFKTSFDELVKKIDEAANGVQRDRGLVLKKSWRPCFRIICSKSRTHFGWSLRLCVGLLNSPEYQQKHANDFKTDLARIPVVKDIREYAEIGQELLDLHINYEEVRPYDGCKIVYCDDNPSYKAQKIRFKSRDDHTVIKFNNDITIENVLERAYEYIVNTKCRLTKLLKSQMTLKTTPMTRSISSTGCWRWSMFRWRLWT